MLEDDEFLLVSNAHNGRSSREFPLGAILSGNTSTFKRNAIRERLAGAGRQTRVAEIQEDWK